MQLYGWCSLPLIGLLFKLLGIAVDDGVHMVHRFLAEKGDLARTLSGTGRSIMLTSATTVAAFGTLAFTSHRGLASFAIALSLGVMFGAGTVGVGAARAAETLPSPAPGGDRGLTAGAKAGTIHGRAREGGCT